MRDYAKVSPQFWLGSTGRNLRKRGREAQLVALYLITNPHANMLGLYYLPTVTIAHETGCSLEGASKALRSLIEGEFCDYDDVSEVVWVFEMARFQISESLTAADKRCKGIQNEYDSLPNNRFLKSFYEKYHTRFHMEKARESASPSEAPYKPHRSQEQEQEQEQEKIKAMSGKPDADPPKPKLNDNGKHAVDARQVLAFLNEKAGRRYQANRVNIGFIVARLRDGATVSECRQVIAKKTREWLTDEKMAEYLRPSTLFNATKFAQYQGELVVPLDVPRETIAQTPTILQVAA